MSFIHVDLRVVVLAAVVSVVPAAAVAQNGTDPRFKLGPLGVTPRIDVSAGRDSNLYFDEADPQSDVASTISPSSDFALRLPRVQLTGRSQADAVYYKQRTDLRAVDLTSSGRVDLLVSRLTPYITGARMVTRHRRNLEVDARVRRDENSWSAGTDFRVTAKLSVGGNFWKSDVNYEGDTIYLGSDLAALLNHSSSGEQVSVRYAVTPLTTVGVEVLRGRDRFAGAPHRDANNVTIAPVVEFKPFAIVDGRAQVGFRRRTFLATDAAPYEGAFVQVGLGYTLLGRTRFSVDAQRDVQYTYLQGETHYLFNGVSLSVAHSLSEPWEVSGRVARYQFRYDLTNELGPRETVLNYGGGVAYLVGRGTRVGLQVEQDGRDSRGTSRRHYDRTLISVLIGHSF